MIIRKCDRCGKNFTKLSSALWYEFFRKYRIKWAATKEQIDLCRDCEKDFEAFLKEKRNV